MPEPGERAKTPSEQIRQALREKALRDGGGINNPNYPKSAKLPPQGDLQDGMLVYYREAVKLTDWYAERENETQPFDYRDLMVIPPKLRK